MKKIVLVIFLFAAIQIVHSQKKFKEVITAQDVIDNYVTAIGGANKIKKIKSETLTGDLKIEAMQCGFFVFRNDTMNFTKAEGFAHGKDMVLLHSLTTNSYAWEYQIGSLKEYQGDELLSKQQDLVTGNINFILNYDKIGYTAKLKESDTINGNFCFTVELSKNGNVVRTNYYDPETFYLKKFIKPNNVSIELDDYREVSGIYRPFKIIQRSPMELTILYKEYEFNKIIDISLLSKPTNK